MKGNDKISNSMKSKGLSMFLKKHMWTNTVHTLN